VRHLWFLQRDRVLTNAWRPKRDVDALLHNIRSSRPEGWSAGRPSRRSGLRRSAAKERLAFWLRLRMKCTRPRNHAFTHWVKRTLPGCCSSLLPSGAGSSGLFQRGIWTAGNERPSRGYVT